MSRTMDKPERISRAQWLLLIEAGAWLGAARLAVLTLPFRWVMRACGAHMAESTRTLTEPEALQRERVAWAVNTMRLFTPWDSNCLAQAITAARMLQRRGVATTTYLGLTRGDEKPLDAHAWLRCGDAIITGDQQLDTYTQVASFATTIKGK